jgi:hypothetical protein
MTKSNECHSSIDDADLGDGPAKKLLEFAEPNEEAGEARDPRLEGLILPWLLNAGPIMRLEVESED